MKRKSIFYFVGLVILLIIIFLLFKCQQRNIYSYFDNNDEGWKVVGDVQNALAKPDYHNTDGNPGGYLSATDNATGGDWYWSAPKKFLGSKKGALNKKLEYDLKQSDLNNQYDAADIILESKDLTLVYSFPSHPGTTWTSFSVILSPEAGWKKNSTDGQAASKEDLLMVLSRLKSLKIRGEFITGPDVGSIDNVCLYLK
jgi:hypothetical protein